MSHFLLNHFLSTYFEGHVSIFQCTPDLLMFKAVIVEEKEQNELYQLCGNIILICFVVYSIISIQFCNLCIQEELNNMVSHIDPIYQIHSHMLIFGMQYCIQKDKQYSIGSAEF